ncbi:GD10580 [Drosophila simulans]|uniref:GD10580 n=1 Tax=Drosophila simulans TaxID=7240 RepID=B4QG54_DROSI|nr:GD10580 [Drosophila simulans]
MMPLQESPSPSWQLEDYAFFRKCGEITASPDVQSFGFNCAFCPAICLQFSVFMDHIRVQHTQDVSRRYETEEERCLQTDLVIMELDCPEIYPPETPRKCNWEADMDIQLMSLVPSPPAVHIPPPALPPPPETPETPEIDLVYVVENPLPPSPPPSADISGDELPGSSPQSFDLDPFAVLHEVVAMTPPTPVAPPPGPSDPQTDSNCDSGPTAAVRDTTRVTQSMEMGKAGDQPHPTVRTSAGQDGCLAGWKSRRELERNHEFVGCLLRAYERTEKLWNPRHPDYKYNANRTAYGELAGPLEAICHRQLSGAEIFAVLKELRCRYRRELKKVNALGGKYKSRLWYFERMGFLRCVIENRRAEREAKISNESTESEKSCETDADSCGKSSLYHEVLSFILDAFKRQECLWNPQHYDYTTCSKTELFRDISVQLQEELNYELSGEECCNEIQKLRTRYRKELRMVIKHKGLYLPKLWCYDEMEFLQPILQEQIFNKISKKIGVVGSNQKTKFIDASSIRFDNSENQLQFVEIYHNYSALWDVDHPDFRSNTYRSQALGQMLDEINTTFHTSYTAEQLEKTLFNLRKDFSAQKRKILTESEDSSSIPLLHAKLAEFLDQNLGPFRCDICSELVKTCDQYKVHRSAHDGTQPFICTLCGKGFQMPCNLTVHIRRHRRDFPYSCEQCDKRFATSTEVAIHLRTHTGERPYICDLCGKSFKTWSFFDIHRRRHLNQSTFHCPICAKGFYEKNRFTDHMNSHWAIRKHLCTVCGKTFTTYGNLKKHTELHLAVKKYKCSTCGKRFAQFASLRWHKKREHSSEGQAGGK